MSYTPEEPGVLTIYLKAFNALLGQNITKHILVQNLLTAAVLYAAPQDTFINKTITLRASITPRSNPVECLWDFADGSTPVHTNTTTVGYKYRYPGHYLVQVCSFESHYSIHPLILETCDKSIWQMLYAKASQCSDFTMCFPLLGELQ